jgi:methyl-accepting chemotaxis protein
MRLSFLRDMSIPARLGLLTAFIALAMGGNLWIARASFLRLSKALSAEGVDSSLVVDCAMVERQVYQAWIGLSRAEALTAKDPGAAAGAIDEYKKAVSACKVSLQSLSMTEGLPADILPMIESVNVSFGSFAAEAAKMTESLDSGKYNANTAMTATLRYKALTNDIAKLFTKINLSSLATVNTSGAAAASAQRLMTAISALLTLVCAIFAVFMIRSITRPLYGLVEAVGKIGGGDLTATAEHHGKDELGRIGASVNGLASDLRDLVSTVKLKLHNLDESGQSLASNMEETGAAVIEINANIGNAQGQLESQATAVKEVMEAMKGLALRVDKLAEMIQRQSASVSQSSASVEEMIANIESVAANVEGAAKGAELLSNKGGEGKARINEVNETVESIVRYSENLNEAARLITEIADRTNLLAMNAAIEAAHAGDAGKGFAVVADEIRRLAEQSTARSKEISSDLGKVGSAIESVRGAAGAAVLSFGTILDGSSELGTSVSRIGEAMREQRIGGRQVLESLSELVGLSREIAEDAASLKSGNASVLERVETLDSMNRLVVQNSEEILQGTREINEAITGTGDLTVSTTSLIGEVMASVDKFTV